jgi:hypothetical protein
MRAPPVDLLVMLLFAVVAIFVLVEVVQEF